MQQIRTKPGDSIIMGISRKQLMKFHQINEKLKTNSLFFITNYCHLLKKYSYLNKSRCILKWQLKLKKNTVVILYNRVKTLGSNIISKKRKKDSKMTKRKSYKKFNTCERTKCNLKKSKKAQSEVSEQIPGISKSKESANEIEEIDLTFSEVNLVQGGQDDAKSSSCTTEDLHTQLRAHLNLLKSSKRQRGTTIEKSISQQCTPVRTTSYDSTPSFSRHESYSSLENEVITPTNQKTADLDHRIIKVNSPNKKTKFIDSLLNKLITQGRNLGTPNNNVSTSINESQRTQPQPKPPFDGEKSRMNIVNDDEQSNHSDSSKNDFLGFRESETEFERPNIPGMLPTPKVKRSKGVESAFVSVDLDNFMKENSLENSSYKTAPLKKRHDEAMMYADAEPPTLLCPILPSDVEKPRTVAEKRQLLEKKADIKYLMIENESTVYRELRKRSKIGLLPNYKLIRNIQATNIPFTRDCWRATCWLNTPNGSFYFQTINDNGKNVKVLGGNGNNPIKELLKIKPISNRKLIRQDCSKCCKLIGNIKINGLDDLVTLSESTKQQTGNSEITYTSKKLNTLSESNFVLQPAPLSQKKLSRLKSSIDVELGPLELYSLPRILLQVWPKIDRPLPDILHPYLKLALPFHKISPEWAEFALSTLKSPVQFTTRGKRKRAAEAKECNRSFTFNIPYANNQNRILVRKRRQITSTTTPLNLINENEDAALSFMKNINKTDAVAVAVADILAEMIISVSLTLSEASVIKDDPDIDYGKIDTQIDATTNRVIGFDGKKINKPTGKIFKELKKLNAKIIHGFDTIRRECRNDFCRLGCLCDSLRGAQTCTNHCKEVNCMFQCTCPSSKINTSTFESAVHNSDIRQFCDRMNASLAKEEKDFTATVVVSGGKTIYVPTLDEKKKRNKKVPKRFSDCVHFESESLHRDNKQSLIRKEEERIKNKVDIVDAQEKSTLASYKNDIINNMVHVSVNVERLSILDNLQPFCMFHCLYKCFCRFKALEGERFEFGNTKIDMIEQPVYTKKRQYTFERSSCDKATKTSKTTSSASFPEDEYSCRRVCVVATEQYKIINLARVEEFRKRIKNIEQDNPDRKILLKNRIKQSRTLVEVGPPVKKTRARRTANRSEPPYKNELFPEEIQLSSAENMNISNIKEEPVDSDAPSTSALTNASIKTNNYRVRFNNIIMKTMQGITHKLRQNKILPSPINKSIYYIQWKRFLQAFNADKIYIWEVQLNTEEVLLVVTDKNIMPFVSNAMYVINIKAVSSERLPMFPKLIKLGIMNEKTKNMSILLFGIANYWRVLGATHSENDFLHESVVAVPTPDTKPRLASKISVLFDEMVKWSSRKQLAGSYNANAKVSRSNICVRDLDHDNNVQKIHLPIPVYGSHRWLMLSLSTDFTHIFVPPWKYFISYEKIQSAIAHANQTQKTVKMGPSNVMPYVYVPPNCDMKIFFGPVKKNETLDLQLLQHCGGKMLLREDYQRITKSKPLNGTVGSWLYVSEEQKMKNDQIKAMKKEMESMTDKRSLSLLKRKQPLNPNFAENSPSTFPTFIRLKPTTITSGSSNLNISVIEDDYSSTVSQDTSAATNSIASTSSTIPSSELIRHLSLGLRERPAKVSTIVSSFKPSPLSSIPISTESHESSSAEITPINAKADTIISPPATLSNLLSSIHHTLPSTTMISSSKPAPLSSIPISTESSSTRITPINAKKETIISPPANPSNLLSLIHRTLPSTITTSSTYFMTPSNHGTQTVTSPYNQPKLITVSLAQISKSTQFYPKPVPSISSQQIGATIRDRRYTTIIPKPSNTSTIDRPPIRFKNFELLQNSGNKLTLTPISGVVSPSQIVLKKPMIIKKIDIVKPKDERSLLRQRSKTIDRPKSIQPVSSSPNVEHFTNTNSKVTVKLSSVPSNSLPAPILKPDSFNLPSKSINTKNETEGKPGMDLITMPKIRLIPRSIQSLTQPSTNTQSSNEVIDCDGDNETITQPNKYQFSVEVTESPVMGFLISQVRGLGKIRTKKLRECYVVNLCHMDSKYFTNFKQCCEFLNNKYIKERIFALVPATLSIEWKFVFKDEDHSGYNTHTANMLRSSMIVTKDEVIDLNSDFDSNESYSMDLRHHLLVLRLANACMKNVEARKKSGLEIVRKSELVVKDLIANGQNLEINKKALIIEKNMMEMKIDALRKNIININATTKTSMPIKPEEEKDVINLDSDDD